MSQFRLGLVAAVVAGCAGDASLVVEPGESDGGGKADSDEPRAELKITIEPTQIARARSRLSLRNDKSQTRRIYFYDTPSLVLLDSGTILRAREIDGEDDDSTVKLRPFTIDQLGGSFQGLDGLKCEVDRTTEHASSACSLKVAQDEGEIADVADGLRDIDKLFSSEQEDLFATYGPSIGWDELYIFGPIPARVWTIRTSALPEKLTAELWYLPDSTQMLELSMKVDVDDADDAMDELLDFVDARGLDLADEQESKTRRALEAFL